MRRTVTTVLTTAAVGGALIATAAVGQAQQAQRSSAARGTFSFYAMTHTNNTAKAERLPGVSPWNGTSRGRFAYRGIPCTGNAPVNNISSDLPTYNGRVRGSRAPSSTRMHPLSFKVVRTQRGVEMIGNATIVVCQLRGGPTPALDSVPDTLKPRIRVAFRAKFKRENAENLRYQGTFKIVGGTQRYAGLTGAGTIAGYLFCFDPKGCAATGGRYLDGQLSMQGTYRDPTPRL